METKKSFSAISRQNRLAQLHHTQVDVVIIGGGITGAGIALDAALRGLSVVVVDKQDFAAGTSSRSTKLIHGGLRYLKQLELNLVREVGQERAIIYRAAPHIVRPRQMLLPIIADGSLGKHSTSVGLYMYDLLAGVDSKERRTMHSAAATAQMEPLLRTDILEGGGLYWEYQTDDARLTIEVLKTAIQKGAEAFNYAEVSQFCYHANGKVSGVQISDQLHQQTITLFAKVIVNAAGPWVDEVRSKDHAIKGKRLHLTKGVHLVVDYQRLPLQQAVYFDVQDGRMIFAIPKGNTTYIGTTDTNYKDGIDRPQATTNDVAYILAAVNAMFPTVQLTTHDVQSSWTGLRPLIHEDGKSPAELSRKDEIFVSKSGIISMAGGKLTGFRKMAERAVDEVVKRLYITENRDITVCSTEDLKFSGGKFTQPNDRLSIYIEQLHHTTTATRLSRTDISDLVHKYGSNTPIILDYYTAISQQRSSLLPTVALLFAELRYGAEHEMVCTLSDFLIRRTGRLYFDRPHMEHYYFDLLDELERILHFSKQQKLQQLNEFEAEYAAVLQFTAVSVNC